MKLFPPYLSRNILTLFVFAFFFAACNNQENKSPEANYLKADSGITVGPLIFDKLVGVWQSEDGKTFERWTKNENGTFRSVVFNLKGTDTFYTEQASIYPENDQWVFENMVTGQNEGKSVKFLASSVNENNVQFSNPAHDFPTDVNYSVPDNNTVNAFIVGPNKKGGKDTIPFNYKRVK